MSFWWLRMRPMRKSRNFFLFRNTTLKNEMCSERRICLGSVHHRTVWDFYPLWESSRVSFLPLLWAFCSHFSEPVISCSFQPQISFLPPLWVEGIRWDLGENSPYQPRIGQDGNLVREMQLKQTWLTSRWKIKLLFLVAEWCSPLGLRFCATVRWT